MYTKERRIKSYWNEALMTAMFLWKRCPILHISQDKPVLSVNWQETIVVEPQGVWIPRVRACAEVKAVQFDSKSVRCSFLSYSEHEKVYRLEDLESGRFLLSVTLNSWKTS